MYSESQKELPKWPTIELGAVVRHNGIRDPEPNDNILPYKLLGLDVPNTVRLQSSS